MTIAGAPDTTHRHRDGIAITKASRERVVGEMRLGPERVAEDGHIAGGALLALADALVLAGARLCAPPAHQVTILEVKATFFQACGSGAVGAEAIPLHVGDTVMVWQTGLYSAQGGGLAATTHTLLIAPPSGIASGSSPAERIDEDGVFPAAALAGAGGAGTAGAAPASGATAEVPASAIARRRREEIAAAACDVIARKGFAAATIREIADAAGMHVPTLYQHVSSKDEVLELVYSWAMERARTDVDLATKGCPGAREKLHAAVTAIITSADRNRKQIGVLNRELKSLSEKARLRVLGEYHGILQQLADLVGEGVASGEFRPVHPAIVANIIDAIADIWALRPFALGGFGLPAYRDEAVAFIMTALTGRPE